MIVSRRDLDACLDRLHALVEDPRQGLYGPDSMAWRINKESALFLGGGRAALLQIAHPFVAHAVDQHSQTRTDPQGRFVRTFTNVFAMVFGDLDHAVKSARRVHAIHSRITGEIREDVGAYSRGTRYAANDAGALMWVHATLVDTAVTVYEQVVGRLRLDEKERYYDESRRFAYLFGIPDSAQPAGWSQFQEYWADMLASERLAVGAVAAELAGFLLEPPRRALAPAMDWYRAITAGLMPERLRAPFGLRFGRRERVVFSASLAGLRAAHRVTPRQAHYLPAYVAARRRLAGRRPGYAMTRLAEALVERGLSRSRAA